ncbi:MAG: NAD(P)-dependent oxidoreductase [Oscillospiraceae bacterium]|nr:NAD(P)-dependent oxidoreductase [Oscillospiraceae bacterium]
MKILVTGAAGQLGMDVMAELETRTQENRPPVLTQENRPPVFLGIDIADLDITDGEAVRAYLTTHKPQCVIHCAAYTAVDKAEDEPELCFKVNVQGTENLAKACREIDAEMIYISTDYVFSGEGDKPYETDAVKEPVSTYGKSKLAGEEAVAFHLDRYYIVRISWVFGSNGGNFVKTMLRLATRGDGPSASQTNRPPPSAKQGDRPLATLNVVDDQIGSPTYTPDLAVLLCDMALSGKYGTYHATNEGFCSWAEFATEIMRQSNSSCKINPIPTEQYPTKAKRPKNSKLSKASLDEAGFIRLPEWQDALERFIQDR